jgi:aspartate oxidase
MMTMNGDQDPAFYTSSPYLRATKSAVDTALANERDRIKHLEAQEATFSTVEELKAALKKERQHSKHIVGELAALKSVAVASTLEAEVCEEGRINCLMRRLDILQKEKGRIIVELEREEEMVSSYAVVRSGTWMIHSKK